MEGRRWVFPVVLPGGCGDLSTWPILFGPPRYSRELDWKKSNLAPQPVLEPEVPRHPPSLFLSRGSEGGIERLGIYLVSRKIDKLRDGDCWKVKPRWTSSLISKMLCAAFCYLHCKETQGLHWHLGSPQKRGSGVGIPRLQTASCDSASDWVSFISSGKAETRDGREEAGARWAGSR